MHAALRLPDSVPAFDLGGSVRSAAGALRFALAGGGTTLVVTADLRTGLPGSADEAAGGDAAAALLVGDGDGVVAEYLGGASATEEFLDRWRTPGRDPLQGGRRSSARSPTSGLGRQAFKDALAAAGLAPADVDVRGRRRTHRPHRQGHGRQARRRAGRRPTSPTRSAPPAPPSPALLLAAMLEAAAPGQVIALVVLADGADVLLFRTTEALAAVHARPAARRPARGRRARSPTAGSCRGGACSTSSRPAAPSRPARRPRAAARTTDWKFGFVGAATAPTAPCHAAVAGLVRRRAHRRDGPEPMADVNGTIATFTVDRLAYSPSPPVVFAVVDFDGGGRLPIELTDVDADEVAIGDRVEMTFRKLFTADGIHNYFWKGKLIRG